MLVLIGFSLALILSLFSMSLFLSFGGKCDIEVLGVCSLLLIIQVIHLRVSRRRNFNFWNMLELLRFLRSLWSRLYTLCFTRWLWGGGFIIMIWIWMPPEANVLSLFWEVVQSFRDEVYLGNYQLREGISESQTWSPIFHFLRFLYIIKPVTAGHVSATWGDQRYILQYVWYFTLKL